MGLFAERGVLDVVKIVQLGVDFHSNFICWE